MIKLDIINRVADKTGVPKQKAEQVVDALFNAMKEAMANGNRIELSVSVCSSSKRENAASDATRAPARKSRFRRAKPSASNRARNCKPKR